MIPYPDPSPPEIHKVLVLSTAHLHPHTAGVMDRKEQLPELFYDCIEGGYIVWVFEDDDSYQTIYPAEVQQAAVYAHGLGCGCIHYDMDGPINAALPTFDW